jgi:hypothetical protein
MIDRLRRLTAKFLVAHFTRPIFPVAHLWLWFAAEAHDIHDKRCSLNAVLDLDPENGPALLALAVPDEERPESWAISRGRLRASPAGASPRLRPC